MPLFRLTVSLQKTEDRQTRYGGSGCSLARDDLLRMELIVDSCMLFRSDAAAARILFKFDD